MSQVSLSASGRTNSRWRSISQGESMTASTPSLVPTQPSPSQLSPVPRPLTSRRSSLSNVDQSESPRQLVTQRSQPVLMPKSPLLKSARTPPRRGSQGDEYAETVSIPGEYANSKKNNEFHTLFRSIPEDELLMEDYGCALQKEILLQGRLYVSEHHLCFNANIFGWVTNLVIAFVDIIDIEKRSTALVIPNAIQITTLQSKFFFATFLSRDNTYDRIVGIWRAPQLLPSHLHNTSKYAEVQDGESWTSDFDSSTETSDDGKDPVLASVPIVYRTAVHGQASDGSIGTKVEGIVDECARLVPADDDEKECRCMKSGDHFPHTVMDQTYSGNVGLVYNLLYHGDFFKKFLIEIEKNTDIDISPWSQAPEDGQYSRKVSFTKNLKSAIGPKSTRCILNEQIQHLDMGGYISLVTTAQTPDVPSGNAFVIKNRVCIFRAGNDTVRVLVTVLVDFSRPSWLKSTIEKASIDGQISYYKSLDAAMRKYTESHASIPTSMTSATHHPQIRQRRGRKRPGTEKEPIPIVAPNPTHHDSLCRRVTETALSITVDVVAWAVCQARRMIVPKVLVTLFVTCVMFSHIYVAVKISNINHIIHQMDHTRTVTPWATYSANCPWSYQAEDPASRGASDDMRESDPGHTFLADDNTLFSSRQQHMDDLETMVQQVGQRVEQVSKMVEQQRQQLLSNLPPPSPLAN